MILIIFTICANSCAVCADCHLISSEFAATLTAVGVATRQLEASTVDCSHEC